MRRRLPRPPAALVVLLVTAALGSIAWSIVVPPFNTPDEDTHFAYVQRIVETGELPQDVDPASRPFSTEVRTARYWSGLFQTVTVPYVKPLTSDVEREGFEAESREGLPTARRDDGRAFSAAANNPPLYYLYAAAPYVMGYEGDVLLRVQLMRWAGVPLLLIVVASAWLLTAELLPRPRWARVLAAAVVAVQPQLSFVSGAVGPDIMLAAIWSALLVVAVRTARHGPTIRRALALGLLCAASALTQPRGLGIALPALLAVGLGAHALRVPLRRALRPAGAVLGLAVAGFAGYYLVTTVLGSDATSGQLSGAVGGSLIAKELLSYLWQFYLPPLPFMGDMIGPDYGFRQVYVETFLGVYGTLDVTFPVWVYTRLHQLVLQALAALVVCLILQRHRLRRHWRELLVLAGAVVGLLAVVHFAAYRGLVNNGGTDPIIVGRYLFPLMPLFALGVAFVCTTIRGRWGEVLAAGAVAVVVLLQLGGLGLAVTRYYGG